MSNISKLITALVSQKQEIEAALQALLTERAVDTAVGDQLDLIGALVGEPRGGKTDTDYRRYVRARISVNRSDGLVEDILTVAVLVVNDDTAGLRVEQQGHATVVLKVVDASITTTVRDALISLLRDTVKGGVRIIVESATVAPNTWFTWDTVGLGWDNGKFIDAVD